jgi:protein translocase SEC61 complex gamma subunit
VNALDKLGRFVSDARHVMSMSYRPSPEEFNKSAKVIIIGILVVGAMGFIISLIVTLIISGTLPI